MGMKIKKWIALSGIGIISIGVGFSQPSPSPSPSPQAQIQAEQKNMKPLSPQNQANQYYQSNIPQNQVTSQVSSQEQIQYKPQRRNINPFLEENFKRLLRETINSILKEYEKKVKAEYELKYIPQLEKMKIQILRLQNQKFKLEMEREKLKLEMEKLKRQMEKLKRKKEEEENNAITDIKIKSYIKLGGKYEIILEDGTIIKEGSRIGKYYVKKITKDGIVLVDNKGNVISIQINLK
jgi:hypothetical protein